MLVLAGWLRDDTTKRAQRLLSDGRYLELDANLRYFDERYSRILVERETGALEEWRGEAYRRDRELYDAYVDRRVRPSLERRRSGCKARSSAGAAAGRGI